MINTVTLSGTRCNVGSGVVLSEVVDHFSVSSSNGTFISQRNSSGGFVVLGFRKGGVFYFRLLNLIVVNSLTVSFINFDFVFSICY